VPEPFLTYSLGARMHHSDFEREAKSAALDTQRSTLLKLGAAVLVSAAQRYAKSIA